MSLYEHQRVHVGPRSSSGLGNMRMLSINTWIILINVIVFVLNNVSPLQSRMWPVGAGVIYNQGVTPDQISRAKVDRQHPQFNQADGTWHLPVFDPQTVRRDLLGNASVAQIGYERFRPQPVIEAFGHFSTSKFWNEGQLWRLVTFQFLHANLSHIVFNMLGLFFFGGLVEQYLGRRRYAVFYLLSGICGALAYMTLNLLGYSMHAAGLSGHVPFLLFDDPYTPLVGASAGVFGVLLAAAFIAPSAIVQVMFVIPMKLRTAVYIFLALAVWNLYQNGHNAGGDAAHVGGALAGALLIRRPYILRDFVTLFGLIRPRTPKPVAGPGMAPDAVIEAIFHKAREEGVESLSPAERAIVRRVAQSSGGA